MRKSIIYLAIVGTIIISNKQAYSESKECPPLLPKAVVESMKKGDIATTYQGNRFTLLQPTLPHLKIIYLSKTDEYKNAVQNHSIRGKNCYYEASPITPDKQTKPVGMIFSVN